VRPANQTDVEKYVAEIFIIGDLQPVFTYTSEFGQIYGRGEKDWMFGCLSESC